MNRVSHGALNYRHVRRRFDRAADVFTTADFVHRSAADGLMQRLGPMTVAPNSILDLGSARGASGRQLSRHFKRARVVNLDASFEMLKKGRSERNWFSKIRDVQGDAFNLPFSAASFDLVFANMLLPWIDNLPLCLSEVARVLRKNGLFMFSTLGPASLAELREAWGEIDQNVHVNRFADMHDIGDAMVRSGLSDPVLDIDHLKVTYPDIDALFADLTAAGARNSLMSRNRFLTGKGRIARLRELMHGDSSNAVLRLNLELVYGHAWGGGPQPKPGEHHLSPADIGRRRR